MPGEERNEIVGTYQGAPSACRKRRVLVTTSGVVGRQVLSFRAKWTRCAHHSDSVQTETS